MQTTRISWPATGPARHLGCGYYAVAAVAGLAPEAVREMGRIRGYTCSRRGRNRTALYLREIEQLLADAGLCRVSAPFAVRVARDRARVDGSRFTLAAAARTLATLHKSQRDRGRYVICSSAHAVGLLAGPDGSIAWTLPEPRMVAGLIWAVRAKVT